MLLSTITINHNHFRSNGHFQMNVGCPSDSGPVLPPLLWGARSVNGGRSLEKIVSHVFRYAVFDTKPIYNRYFLSDMSNHTQQNFLFGVVCGPWFPPPLRTAPAAQISSTSCSGREPLGISGSAFAGQVPFLACNQPCQNMTSTRGISPSDTILSSFSFITGLLGEDEHHCLYIGIQHHHGIHR